MDDSARLTIMRRAVAERPELWAKAVGCRVRHGTYDMGTIATLARRDGPSENFLVRFDQTTNGKSERLFKLEALFKPERFPERHLFLDTLEEIFARRHEDATSQPCALQLDSGTVWARAKNERGASQRLRVMCDGRIEVKVSI